jgi:hypothetical protein
VMARARGVYSWRDRDTICYFGLADRSLDWYPPAIQWSRKCRYSAGFCERPARPLLGTIKLASEPFE